MTFQGWFDSFIWTHQSTADVMRACWQAATLAEREACAKVCDAMVTGAGYREAACADQAAEICAEAIRARGEI
jgi:hypothetical protein